MTRVLKGSGTNRLGGPDVALPRSLSKQAGFEQNPWNSVNLTRYPAGTQARSGEPDGWG